MIYASVIHPLQGTVWWISLVGHFPLSRFFFLLFPTEQSNCDFHNWLNYLSGVSSNTIPHALWNWPIGTPHPSPSAGEVISWRMRSDGSATVRCQCQALDSEGESCPYQSWSLSILQRSPRNKWLIIRANYRQGCETGDRWTMSDTVCDPRDRGGGRVSLLHRPISQLFTHLAVLGVNSAALFWSFEVGVLWWYIVVMNSIALR